MIRRFWDWQSQYPEDYFTYQFGAEIAAYLARYLRGRARILDYGCGVGYLIPHLCRHAAEVYAADTSAESIHEVNRRLAGTPRFKGAFTFEALDAAGLRFDAVISIEVVEHLYDDALSSMLADIRARLAPDGIAIVTTPNREDLGRNMILCPESGRLFHRWQHVRSWTPETLTARLRAERFSPVETIETNLLDAASSTPFAWLRRKGRHWLMGNPGKPHLVCIARSNDARP